MIRVRNDFLLASVAENCSLIARLLEGSPTQAIGLVDIVQGCGDTREWRQIEDEPRPTVETTASTWPLVIHSDLFSVIRL